MGRAYSARSVGSLRAHESSRVLLAQLRALLYICRMSDDRQLFSVVVTEDGCLALSGELDLLTVRDLNDALGTRNGARDVTLDVSGLTFIDSSGLHAIVTFLRSREEGTVTLRGVSPELLRILEITQLTKLPRLLVDG